MILVEPDQRIAWANDAALAMHGVDALAGLGATVDDYRTRFVLCYRNHRAPGRYPIERVVAGESFRDVVVEVAHADRPDVAFVHSLRSFVVTHGDGRPSLLALIVKDVSAQFEAEERFESAFNANPAPAAIVRLSDLRLVRVNAGFLQLTGYPRDAVLGRSVYEVDPLAGAHEREAALAELAAGRPISHREAFLSLPGGGDRAVIGAGQPIEMADVARIVLFSAERLSVQDVARRAGVSRPAVWRWQRRYAEAGVEGLLRDKTRPPGTPPHSTETVAEVLALTCSEPPGEVTHWTGRAVARAVGISLRAVQRIWDAHRLQPHRLRTFKRSRDPAFAAKVEDVVGLYMAPPAHAVVLSIDEKSQIQALERTRPNQPLGPRHPAAQTHNYTRHGTTTLFAALDVLAATVLGRCMQRHRNGEFIRFLNAVEATVPPGKAIHAILNNVATHKHPKVRAWLARHPRWTFHFTPTSASWLNAVEDFFSALTRRRLRRGSFTGVVDLQAAIKRYIAEHNRRARPFVWTKPATDILAAVSRSPEPSV